MASVIPFDQEKNQLNEQQLNENQDDYDEFRRPPILDICLKHQSATLFARADANTTLNKDNACPCCGQPIELKPLPITASILDFSFIGPGVSLYFDFLIFSSILIAVFIIVCGIYDIIASTLGDTCQFLSQGGLDCKTNFYNKFAKANQDNKSIDKAGSALNFVVSFILIVLQFFYRKRINQLTNKIDENSILPSDYSIYVENIPTDAKEEEIKQFFSKINNRALTVKKICMGYDLTQYLSIETKKLEKENQYTKILECERLGKPLPPNLQNKQTLTSELNQLTLQLNNLELNVEQNFSFTGVAIVSFSLEDEAKFVCKSFKTTRLQLIISQFMKVLGQGDRRKFRDNLIVVKQAPEPGDIIWKNLGIPLLELYKRKLLTNIATFFLLGICFGFLFGLSYAQFAIADTNATQQASTGYTAKSVAITVLGVISSVLISIINFALGVIIRKFSEHEAPTTKTEFDIIAAKKLGIAQFLNTAIITLIVNLVIVKSGETSYWAVIKQGGLNQDVMLIFITNGITPWFMNLIDLNFLYKIYQRYQIKLQGENCNIVQKDANEIFSGPKFDLSKKYAQLGKTLMFTFFYAYLIPLGPVLSFASLIVIYWVEKFLLLRRDSKPAPLGSELAEEMIDFYGEFTLIIYAIGCLSWETILNDKIFALTWVQFGFAAFNFLFPIDTIFNNFFKQEDISTKEFYDNQCYKFWEDYDRRNPVTAEKAIEEFLKNTTAQQSIIVDGRGNVVSKQDDIQKKLKKNKKHKR